MTRVVYYQSGCSNIIVGARQFDPDLPKSVVKFPKIRSVQEAIFSL